DIEMSGNAQRPPLLRTSRERRLERAVRNILDHDTPRSRRWDAEYDVVAGNLLREIRLRDVATGSIRASADHEQRVNAAVRRAVRIAYEPRLADRTIGRDERRHGVLRAHSRRERDLRIGRRTGAPDCRESVASGTAVEIEARPQALGHRIDFIEHA